jgi:hypothetical protein
VSNENNDGLRWEPKPMPPLPRRRWQYAAMIALALAILLVFAVTLLMHHPHHLGP